MKKYVAVQREEDLLNIAEEYREKFGICLNDYRKYATIQGQWENVIADTSNNFDLENVYFHISEIVYNVLIGKYVNKSKDWEQILKFIEKQIEEYALYREDVFLNAFFAVQYLNREKREECFLKLKGVSTDFIDRIDYEIPIKLDATFCRNYQEYIFGRNKERIFDVKHHLIEVDEEFMKWDYKTTKNCKPETEIDNTRWSYKNIHAIEMNNTFKIEDMVLFYKTINPMLADDLLENNIFQDEEKIGNDVYKRIKIIDKICGIEPFIWQKILVRIFKGMEYLSRILIEEKELESAFAINKNNPIFISKNKKQSPCSFREENVLLCTEQLMDLWNIIVKNTEKINYYYNFYSRGLVYCYFQTKGDLKYLQEKCEKYIQRQKERIDINKPESKRIRWGRNGKGDEHLYAWIQSEIICMTMGHYKLKKE